MPHYPENLITFNLIEERNGEITKCQAISRKNFLLMAAGEMRCNVNPELINFFEEKQIPLCTIEYNQPFRTYAIDCTLLDRIWKVRYPYHPKGAVPEDADANVLDNVPDSLKGWARGVMNPSEGQMGVLNRYGIQQTSEVIYGDSLWLFLKDICNAKWVSAYKSS
ncbi:MAG: hypothetical protein AB8B53_02825 [Flavobacteriales bacterium]